MIFNIHLDNFRNLSGNKIWSRLNPTLQRYPNTIPMLKFSAGLCGVGLVGKRGFNKPPEVNGVQRIPVETRRVWWGERWLLLFGKIF